MLGAIDHEQKWRWAAYGKHPVSGDYFAIGDDFPLGKGFENWVARGYASLHEPQNTLIDPVSWRFWSKGSEKETLSCGLVRDITDRIGRPYTILMVGYGFLDRWESHWDLLPWACERSWTQMEHLTTRMFQDLKQLEDEIQFINPPRADWREFEGLKKGLMKDLSDRDILDDITVSLIDVVKEVDRDQAFIGLNQKPRKDYLTLIQLCHEILRKQRKEIPKALFMGGNTSGTYLSFFKRPLVLEDFIRLWTIGLKENILEKG